VIIQDLDIKLAIGLVVNGDKMKLTELDNKIDKKLPYSLVDDAIAYMRNDPQFYRKIYFPAVSKMSDLHRAGKKIDTKKLMGPVVDKGMHSYCKKYKLRRRPSDLFNLDDRQALMDRVCSEELEQIRKGSYL